MCHVFFFFFLHSVARVDTNAVEISVHDAAGIDSHCSQAANSWFVKAWMSVFFLSFAESISLSM